MIHGYIEKESTIILAVHPANTDIATSEALKVAKDYDPEGMLSNSSLSKVVRRRFETLWRRSV